MAKAVTSKKRKRSSKKYLVEHEPFSSSEFKDPKVVANILLDCLRDGDTEAFQDVLVYYILSTNKSQLARQCGLGRQTLYDLADGKKKFNPELSTLAAMFRAMKKAA